MVLSPPDPAPSPSADPSADGVADPVRGLMREASLRLDDVEPAGAPVKADEPSHVTRAGAPTPPTTPRVAADPSGGDPPAPSAPDRKPAPGRRKSGIVVARGWGAPPAT